MRLQLKVLIKLKNELGSWKKLLELMNKEKKKMMKNINKLQKIKRKYKMNLN